MTQPAYIQDRINRTRTSSEAAREHAVPLREQTPLPDDWYRQREAVQEPQGEALAELRTLSLAAVATGLRFSVDGTRSGLSGDDALPVLGDESEAESELDIISKVREERLALLARKYASSTISAEVKGRLQILTERLRLLAPRVSAEEVDNLERARQVATEASAELAAVKARFGLR